MHVLTSIQQRIDQLPRAGRWAVYGLGAILLLAAYSQFVLPTASAWSSRADEIQNELRRANDESQINGRVRQVEPAILAIGPVETPQDEAATSEGLKRAVNDILKRHTVSKDSFTTGSPSKKPNVLGGLLSPGQQAEYMTGQLDFEATQEQTEAIISELEASPAVEAVTTIRLSKLGGADKRLSVKITLEAWTVARATPLGGGVRR